MHRFPTQRVIAGALLFWIYSPNVRAEIAVSDADFSGASAATGSISEITVTARRIDLIGKASTASEGVIADDELQLAPTYRPGQLLETVPGLIVTLHSGEGKANQFLLRGYNLDHGTDLETYVDGIPVNQPTHAHGQGYTDLNFMIPELADGITYSKGPYYANVGDFGAVGSVHVNYRDTIEPQISVTAGMYDFERILAAGSTAVATGNLLAALEVQHYDGPFERPDDARKENFVLRYSAGDERSGYSATAMYYHQIWNNTTDIPLRAIAEGLSGGRFGTLDPTDGGHTQRASFALEYHAPLASGVLSTSSFFEYNQLHIFNDFTHYLFNPAGGDQEDQFENRRVAGGAATYVMPAPVGSMPNEVALGAVARCDWLDVGRAPSIDQIPQPIGGDPASFLDADRVHLFAGGLWLQDTTRWTSFLRTVVGVREDYQHATDDDFLSALHGTEGYTNGGSVGQALFQPKGSVIYTPSDDLEFYASIGRGFHSADVRGVDQDVSVDLGLPHTHLLSKQEGQEVGMRAAFGKDLTFTFAVYNLWQQSETIIDPDIGADTAGPPSRRYGYEMNVTYQINRYLEFYGSYSGDHTRFTHPLDDGTGHLGDFITDAPKATGSLAVYLKDLGPWSGGVNLRYLGNYALSSGPCVDTAAVHDFPGVATSCANAPTAPGQVNGKGFTEVNLDARYAFSSAWSAALGIYNLLNTHAAAAQFWYVDRLRNEVANYADGRADIHEHPLEPIMVRITVTKQF